MRDAKPAKNVLTQADYEALASLRQALRRFTAFSEGAAKTAGLPPQQHQALLAIKGAAAGQVTTVGALAETLLIAPHTATELVDRLADAGLIVRATDPDDRRRHTLQLTVRAETLLAELSQVHLKEIRDLAPRLIAVLQSLAAR
ncbi:MAG TPA: MarR family winged helix-turn-helix transcriptional regulator [Devosiaceae bacterium]